MKTFGLNRIMELQNKIDGDFTNYMFKFLIDGYVVDIGLLDEDEYYNIPRYINHEMVKYLSLDFLDCSISENYTKKEMENHFRSEKYYEEFKGLYNELISNDEGHNNDINYILKRIHDIAVEFNDEYFEIEVTEVKYKTVGFKLKN